MKDFLKRMLDKLPLNGSKTLLGFLIAYLAIKFQVPVELINEILKNLGLDFETIGLGVAAVGLLHKQVK